MIPQLFLENKKRKLQQAFAVGGVAALSSFFLFAPQMAAQDTLHNRPAAKDYHLLFARDLPATWFTTDKLRHIYYILPKNEVIKMDANGTVLFSYFNKTLGPPAWIDATDPFNILLFYPDFQTITLLDRTMNPTGHFNLFEAGLFGINAVCMASDGNLWLYDPINFQLKKTGRHGQFILESADLSLQPGLKEALAPNLLLEKNQRVYLNDPRQGVLVFDIFAKYLKTLPIMGAEQLQVSGDELFFFRKGQLFAFHLLTLLEHPVRLPKSVSPHARLRIEADRLYILDKGRFEVYAF